MGAKQILAAISFEIEFRIQAVTILLQMIQELEKAFVEHVKVPSTNPTLFLTVRPRRKARFQEV